MASDPFLTPRDLLFVLLCESACAEDARAECQHVINLAKEIAQAAGLPLYDGRGLEPDQDLDPACEAIAREKRTSLLLAGGLLEGVVTRMAISMLMDGYDVFVAADLAATAEAPREALFLERIRTYGGNVLTRRQIILELSARAADEETRVRLAQLLRQP